MIEHQPSSDTIKTLVTHSGKFHADEILATIVLTRLYPGAEVVRSRSSCLVERPSPDKIVFDVGGQYDPSQLQFDHHQPDAPLRDSGEKYSAFGLIWKAFGRAYVSSLGVPAEAIEKTWKWMDGGLVRAIDLCDNGQAPRVDGVERVLRSTSITTLIEAFNPEPMAEDAECDIQFALALQSLGPMIEAKVRTTGQKIALATRTEALIEEQWGSPILRLPEPMPFHAPVFQMKADHILFVLHPGRDGFALTSMNTEPGSFKSRMLLPEGWAGLRGAQLDEETGVPGGVFCHAGRWLVIHKDIDGLEALAEIALDSEKIPAPV